MKTEIIGDGFVVRKGGTLALFRDVSMSAYYTQIVVVMDGVEYTANSNIDGCTLAWVERQIKRMYTEEELLEFIVHNFS